MNTMTKTNEKLNTQCEIREAECIELRKDNANLLTQIEALTAQLAKRAWEFYTQKPTLLIGDSLIRDVDTHKLVTTSVQSISGAKIKDISKKISRDENRYKNIVICAGTNDCTRDINIDETAEHFSELLQVATEKVASVGNVTISSIPPRTDNVERQQRVEELNTVLQDMTTKAGANFVSNDKSFRLADGQPNDGYLHNDGVHLNNRGTARMIRNLGLVMRSACEDTEGRQLAAADETDWQTVRPRTTHAKPRRKPQPEHNTREEGHFEAAFWEHAKTKASRKTLVTKPNRERFNNDGTHTRRQQEYEENNAPCYYCAEPSHKTRDCGFKQPVECWRCQDLGHKAKHCYQFHSH